MMTCSKIRMQLHVHALEKVDRMFQLTPAMKLSQTKIPPPCLTPLQISQNSFANSNVVERPVGQVCPVDQDLAFPLLYNFHCKNSDVLLIWELGQPS